MFVFVNIGPYRRQNFKTLLLPQFDPISSKLYDKYDSHGGLQAITFLGNRPSLTILWHFEILTRELRRKTKMWNISKTVFVERNGRKFSTQSTIVHIGRVLLMPDSLSMVWGHLVHFAKFPILRFSKCYSLNRFHQI